MVSKNICNLLSYPDWVKVNESDQADAVHFTIKIDKNIDLSQILDRAVSTILSKFSDIFKLVKKEDNRITLSLKIDDAELGSILTELGNLKNITIDIPISRVNQSKILDLFNYNFSLIYSNKQKTEFTYALKGYEMEFTDEEIIDKILSSSLFIRLIDSSNAMGVKQAEEFILDRENSEEIFFSSTQSPEFHKFKSAMLTLIFNYVLTELVKSSGRFERTHIKISELSTQIDNFLQGVRQEVSQYTTDSNQENLKSIIKKIIEFQTKMVKMIGTTDVRRRLAVQALVKTYDLMGELGLTQDNLSSFLTQQFQTHFRSE
jgi:hypothetical protein